MESIFVQQWEENKHFLEKWFRETETIFRYDDIVKKLFEIVLKPPRNYFEEFDVESMTTIDDGDYQGTQIFLIPYKTYQPNEYSYAVTFQSYGSCSGCDTLLSITGYSEIFPNDGQVKDLMTLALHLVQNAKMLY